LLIILVDISGRFLAESTDEAAEAVLALLGGG